MYSLRVLIAAATLSACDIVAPSLITAPVSEDATPEGILNASAIVLQREGYTVIALDASIGILTTAWQDESSYVDQVLLDLSRRSRVALVLDLQLYQLEVQMTVQKRDGDLPWRNDDLSGSERSRLQHIVDSIQLRIGTAAAARPVAGT